LRNVSIPKTLWVLPDPRSGEDDAPFNGQSSSRWVFDTVECDVVYGFASTWDSGSITFFGEIIEPELPDGVLGGTLYWPRIARDARIIRRGMKLLKNYEESQIDTRRSTNGDLWRFNIPAGLPFVLKDELVFNLRLLARANAYSVCHFIVSDRPSDASAWSELFRFTVPLDTDPGVPDWEDQHQHYKSLKISLCPQVIDYQGEPLNEFQGTVTQWLCTATWSGSYEETQRKTAVSGFSTQAVGTLDVFANGHQIKIAMEYPDFGSFPGGTDFFVYLWDEFRANLRWWPR